MRKTTETLRLWLMWVILCKTLWVIYERAAAKKQVVKPWTESQRSAGEVCLQTAPSSAQKTPTLSLWCLCVFVNEEILVPWWDIALSWADSASSLPSAPAQSHSRPTHQQSHQASPPFQLMEVREVVLLNWATVCVIILAFHIQKVLSVLITFLVTTDGCQDIFLSRSHY